ncbi:MAG: AAA family ATPase [Vicinamibacterales bacterium]
MLPTPDLLLSARDLFGIDTDLQVPAFSVTDEHVPPVDPGYVFERDTTLALLAGFLHNRRVLVQGRHGTGKSSHVEQVAARLNWPCVRVNLDGHVTRMDLIGKDAIVLRDGLQITEFQPGILTWALQRPCALVFDEYDAGRADVMFVIQRVLEVEGRLTLLDQSRVIEPHPASARSPPPTRWALATPPGSITARSSTVDRMDRWNIVVTLNYLPHDSEVAVVLARCPEHDTPDGRQTVSAMVALAALTRRGSGDGDPSTVMSPRTVVTGPRTRRSFTTWRWPDRRSSTAAIDERALVAGALPAHDGARPAQ